MNNIATTALILLPATVIWLSQRATLQATETATAELASQISAASQMLSDARRSLRHANVETDRSRDRLELARAELDIALRETQSVVPVSPDPERDGIWPGNKPFFLLAKKHINQIGYRLFTDAHRLSPEAATLFGMTPAEREAIDAACQAFHETRTHLHAENAKRVEPAAGENIPANRREVKFEIAPVTNEMAIARSQFNDAIRRVLGEQRSELFLERGAASLRDGDGNLGTKGCVVTYWAEQKPDGSIDHGLKIDHPHRGASYGIPIYFPIEPGSPLWRWRHLFGTEPLMPLPEAPVGGN